MEVDAGLKCDRGYRWVLVASNGRDEIQTAGKLLAAMVFDGATRRADRFDPLTMIFNHEMRVRGPWRRISVNTLYLPNGSATFHCNGICGSSSSRAAVCLRWCSAAVGLVWVTAGCDGLMSGSGQSQVWLHLSRAASVRLGSVWLWRWFTTVLADLSTARDGIGRAEAPSCHPQPTGTGSSSPGPLAAHCVGSVFDGEFEAKPATSIIAIL